jgi:hypothetical protein
MSVGFYLACGAVAIAPGGVVILGLYLFMRRRSSKAGTGR